jgi:hypothetical protein
MIEDVSKPETIPSIENEDIFPSCGLVFDGREKGRKKSEKRG